MLVFELHTTGFLLQSVILTIVINEDNLETRYDPD